LGASIISVDVKQKPTETLVNSVNICKTQTSIIRYTLEVTKQFKKYSTIAISFKSSAAVDTFHISKFFVSKLGTNLNDGSVTVDTTSYQTG
jgi:hypothetical protein